LLKKYVTFVRRKDKDEKVEGKVITGGALVELEEG